MILLKDLFFFGNYQDLIPVLNAVGVQGQCTVLQLIGAEGSALVDVVKAHFAGGELHHSLQLLLQLRDSLVQTDTHLLHFVFIAHLHLGVATRSQVDLSQRSQFPIFGHQTVISSKQNANT